MRAEKQFLTNEYIERLKASPFFIVTEYTGITVAQFEELRGKLREQGANVLVVKNSVFRVAAQEAGVADLNGLLDGQLAVVFGEEDIASAAKVVKDFAKATDDKPKIKFGYLGEEQLEQSAVERLADLPSMDVLRGQLLGTIQAPATQLARVIQTPAAMMARVLQAKADKGE
ncbi:MAG: 50S ribosomal protein L10 [Verrucomicrobiales bacterium]|nr:50S ribosomal protein L10 [Verrucomicrobiales bacterium]HCU87483.1 50S ribosomal protein L10 [Verrucomicrobiales bacterium]|tara:strand:+ start:115 stop:630 length:516 start_codon:yes stop_codon:yes gene_type:complete